MGGLREVEYIVLEAIGRAGWPACSGLGEIGGVF